MFLGPRWVYLIRRLFKIDHSLGRCSRAPHARPRSQPWDGGEGERHGASPGGCGAMSGVEPGARAWGPLSEDTRWSRSWWVGPPSAVTSRRGEPGRWAGFSEAAGLTSSGSSPVTLGRDPPVARAWAAARSRPPHGPAQCGLHTRGSDTPANGRQHGQRVQARALWSPDSSSGTSVQQLCSGPGVPSSLAGPS